MEYKYLVSFFNYSFAMKRFKIKQVKNIKKLAHQIINQDYEKDYVL